MYSVKLSFLLIIGASLLSSCSLGIENIKTGNELKPDKGIVVFSLTSSGECGYAIFVDIRRIDGKFDESIGMQDMFEARDWKRKSSSCTPDYEDFSGKLKAIALNEGTYELYKLSGISDHHAFSSEDRFSIKFTVKGNKLTYLGNAHFDISKKTYDFTISDKRTRDINLFEKKYPKLNSEIVIDILEKVVFQGA